MNPVLSNTMKVVGLIQVACTIKIKCNCMLGLSLGIQIAFFSSL